MGEHVWRKNHPDEYRAYQRQYAKEYRKRQKAKPTAKPRGPNKRATVTELSVCELSWNPRILEHYDNYDAPSVVDHV